MCPESLHIYRRMGVAEHERLIKKASMMNVDLIQTTNTAKVTLDQGFAQIVDEVAGERSQACQDAYEAAMKAALDPYQRETGTEPPRPPAQAANSRKARKAVASSTTPAASSASGAAEAVMAHLRPGAPVRGQLSEGTRVAVPSTLWPTYTCDEDGR